MNDLPSNAFGVIKLLPETKEQISSFANQLIRSVENGEVNALQLKAYFKAMEKAIKLVDDSTKDSQLTEAEKYGEKKFNAFGMQIEVCEVGTSYDYEHCNDPEWNSADSQVKTWTQTRKDREQFLRSLKKPEVLVDQMSGEVVTINPPVKKSTTGLKFTV